MVLVCVCVLLCVGERGSEHKERINIQLHF